MRWNFVPPKNGSDAPQCCSAANNFRSLYNVRASLQTLILKLLILSFITSTNGGFAAQMSFQERKIIFSSEVKWITLFDPLNGP